MDQQVKEAIILAGGLGTRLRSEIGKFPKPLADINGKPFLDFILDYLAAHGITQTVLAIGFQGNLIQRHYGNQYKTINLSYSAEDSPLGTGGAIKKALKLTNEKQILILNGDTYFNIDLSALNKFHNQHSGLITLAAKEMHDFDRYGTIEVDDNGQLTGFIEKKSTKRGMINAGIYLVDKEIANYFPPKDVFSFEQEVLEPLTQKKKVFAYPFDNYFIDIGVPDDYNKFKSKF